MRSREPESNHCPRSRLVIHPTQLQGGLELGICEFYQLGLPGCHGITSALLWGLQAQHHLQENRDQNVQPPDLLPTPPLLAKPRLPKFPSPSSSLLSHLDNTCL